ncbi:MAG: alpha/beta hydrolase [Clostridia bacterium]|nr:alpha/beta hydrolase [Clostridia bacterium]
MRTELFGEENFEEKMQALVKPWLSATVRDGYFTTSDGAKLHYHFAIPENAKAAIILVHGYCEFYGKYHELTYYLYNEGYAFFFMEQRGYGYSHRDAERKDFVYIDSFDTYAKDLKEFFDNVVNKEAPDLKKLILSHSMGGAVTTTFLEQYGKEINIPAAVLCSPLIKMETKGIPAAPIIAYLSLMILLGKKYAPFTKKDGFNPVENFPASGTLSAVRYHYLFEQRLNDENFRTWSATYGWSKAALKGTLKLQKHLGEIQTDLLLLTAGRENQVSPKGFDLLIKKAPNITALHFPGSKHEIFNSTDEDRQRFYTELFTFFEEHL